MEAVKFSISIQKRPFSERAKAAIVRPAIAIYRAARHMPDNRIFSREMARVHSAKKKTVSCQNSLDNETYAAWAYAFSANSSLETMREMEDKLRYGAEKRLEESKANLANSAFTSSANLGLSDDKNFCHFMHVANRFRSKWSSAKKWAKISLPWIAAAGAIEISAILVLGFQLPLAIPAITVGACVAAAAAWAMAGRKIGMADIYYELIGLEKGGELIGAKALSKPYGSEPEMKFDEKITELKFWARTGRKIFLGLSPPLAIFAGATVVSNPLISPVLISAALLSIAAAWYFHSFASGGMVFGALEPHIPGNRQRTD